MLEALSRIAGDTPEAGRLRRSTRSRRCARRARVTTISRAGRASRSPTTCSHSGALVERDGAFSSAAAHDHYRERFGVDPDQLTTRRPLVLACSDWTERRPHLAGALGAALLDAMLDKGWLQRRPDGRALNITPPGREFLCDDRRSEAQPISGICG